MSCRKGMWLLWVLMVVFLSASNAQADDVTDAINDALGKYKSGSYTEAINRLNYAEQLITQKKGEVLKEVFPEPLSGWEADEVSSNAVFGGGISAERTYRKDGSSVQISVVSDSPMLQAVMMMFTNPMFATADGGKLETINGQMAIVKYDAPNRSGEVQMVVNNRFLVTVNGSEVRKEDMTGYLQKMDFAKLADMN
ncbi:MAG: hypothetical protein Kow0089_23680 [Desulfobulbaceae bacterium]